MIVVGSGQPLGGRATQAAPAEKPAGSGVIVHSDGYILTAYHVVANAKRIFVVTAGEFRAPAILLSTDSEHDLALLKIETVGLTKAPIGYAGAVRLDQEIITVGFPFGLREVSDHPRSDCGGADEGCPAGLSSGCGHQPRQQWRARLQSSAER